MDKAKITTRKYGGLHRSFVENSHTIRIYNFSGPRSLQLLAERLRALANQADEMADTLEAQEDSPQ